LLLPFAVAFSAVFAYRVHVKPSWIDFVGSETALRLGAGVGALVITLLVGGFVLRMWNDGLPSTYGGGPMSAGWDAAATSVVEQQRDQGAIIADLSRLVDEHERRLTQLETAGATTGGRRT
jgi:hypothetical protein